MNAVEATKDLHKPRQAMLFIFYRHHFSSKNKVKLMGKMYESFRHLIETFIQVLSLPHSFSELYTGLVAIRSLTYVFSNT